MDITLVLVRHSKSCANHVRHVAGTEDRTDPLVSASQGLRDPALSSVGEHMATEYGPELRRKLTTLISAEDRDLTFCGSSGLRRAKQTARLLFGVARPHEYPLFGENGSLPENTPEGRPYAKPSWPATLREVHRIAVSGRRVFILVGHGSFLRSTVLSAVSPGCKFGKPVHNLDAFVVRGSVTATGAFTPYTPTTYIPYTGTVKPTAADKCTLPAKIESNSRMARYTKRSRSRSRSKKQHGGGVGMPLGYYRDGAQMQGTYTDPTGTGIGGSSAAWAREPLPQTQTGGGCSIPLQKQKEQQGGFAPSIMGAFASNGLRLLPIAGYMGYKMWKNGRPTRKHRSQGGRSKSRGTRRR